MLLFHLFCDRSIHHVLISPVLFLLNKMTHRTHQNRVRVSFSSNNKFGQAEKFAIDMFLVPSHLFFLPATIQATISKTSKSYASLHGDSQAKFVTTLQCNNTLTIESLQYHRRRSKWRVFAMNLDRKSRLTSDHACERDFNHRRSQCQI